MLQDPENNKPSMTQMEPAAQDNLAFHDITAEALGALAALDAHASDHLDVMFQFGKALWNAKVKLKHGQFSRWCREALKRSPSWCSAYRRLYECRAELEPALAWAAATGALSRERWRAFV